ncbi:TRAP transporter small permease [Ornithinimicrobium cavernae]|uniref:TRAP transporter small permease n=1 Tax=Ornithinimicrobium cavernae TaxID=2666047 RepID=UPI000D68C9A8|nr:TRAP transporter small permease [Ornithinimicrobium cavernae]
MTPDVTGRVRSGPARALGTADHLVVGLAFWLRVLAGLLIVMMTVTTVYDVIARYFFASPTEWAFTLNSAALLAATLLAMPHLAAIHGHIDMDLVYRRFPRRVQRVLDVVNGLVTLAFGALLAWLGYRAAFGAYLSGLYTSGNFNLPMWVLYAVVYLGGLGLALVILFSPWRRRTVGDDVDTLTSAGVS